MPLDASPIEKWYRKQCNGDWEHQNGVSIETLDNPGWYVKVDLHGTNAEGKTMERTKIKRSKEDWIMYWVEGDKFEIACGPLNLSEALQIFMDWHSSR